jgi:molybdopterin molybdotransferase
MPDHCDTVAMQEDVQLNQRDGKSMVRLPPGLRRGANVRQAGEDVKAGETVLTAGQMIRPQDIAQIASLGLDAIDCYRRLSVGVLSTGDEIRRAGDVTLGVGQVYDANAPLLATLVRAFHADVEDYGVVRDDPSSLRRVLAMAAARHDVVVTSGGASRGEEDHLVAAIDALGTRHLWQIAVKPGRPLSLGHIGGAAVIGLPGNPVAVFVCALLYLKPLLGRLGGGTWAEPRRYPLRAAFAFEGRKPGRREFWRGRLVELESGLAVEKFERDGSGLISGLRASDGLIDIPEERGDVAVGDLVDFIPYTEFGLPARS